MSSKLWLLLSLALVLCSSLACRAAPDAGYLKITLDNSGSNNMQMKIKCAADTGDVAFGPVQGADTSASDGSSWAIMVRSEQTGIKLTVPALDYSTCSAIWQDAFTTDAVQYFTFSLLVDQYPAAADHLACRLGQGTYGPLCLLYDAQDKFYDDVNGVNFQEATMPPAAQIYPPPLQLLTDLPAAGPTPATTITDAAPAPVAPTTAIGPAGRKLLSQLWPAW